MEYCKICLQPDTRPKILFEEGVCGACIVSNQKVDWDARERKLREIVKWAKSNSSGNFNCVIGISGGKDSHFQSLYARDKLGLNALLVNLAPDMITDVGRQNLENLIQKGFDLISYRCNPKVWKQATKRAFYEFGNPVKPSEYPLYAVSYITALKFGIPLVIQGENAAQTLGVLKALDADDDALNVDLYDTLNGCNASDWVDDNIKLEDLIFYQFPNKDELKSKVMGIFLSYYAKEWSFFNNTEFAIAQGLKSRPGHSPLMAGRINPYGSIDSDFQIVNQMLKYYKFGFGFTTDEVCYSIRDGRMKREDAIELVEKYDGKCGDYYINQFCKYIDITVEEFWNVVDRWVNKDLFYKENGKWLPRFKVGVGLIK